MRSIIYRMEKSNVSLSKKICESSTSIVYKGLYTGEIYDIDSVIKFEKNNTDPFLKNEIKLTKYVNGGPGIPKVLGYGYHNHKRFIIYPYCSSTLYNTNIDTINLYDCAYQLLESLEFIHSKGIVHRDISTKNILYHSLKHKFYLNDFGLAKHYNYSIEERKTTQVGSPIFCSINVHNGTDYAPRDDLISLGYVLVWCYKNKYLPWCDDKTCKDIKVCKEKYVTKYFNDNLSSEMKIYLNYCFHLNINQRPNYDMLKKLFLTEEHNDNMTIST